MKSEIRIYIVFSLLLFGGMGFSVQELSAQGCQSRFAREQLPRVRRNIRKNPIDSQRILRQIISDINRSVAPKLCTQEKVEVFFLLGNSYFLLGRIGDAVVHLDSVLNLDDPEGRFYKKAEENQSKIDSLFRPLRITIKGIQIPRLSYIDNIKIAFTFPRRLEKVQIRRLQILQDPEGRREHEFQFVAFDEKDSTAYMEVEYFPIVTFPGESAGYSLIVDNKRRYRFQFTEEESAPLEIFWDRDAEWELIEWVPDDMIKLEISNQYEFAVGHELPSGRYFTVEGDTINHIYMPLIKEGEVVLQKSEEGGWERVYEIVLYTTVGVAGFLGLWGAR